MSLVEETYQQAIAAMTPTERLSRMHGMLHWVRDSYARQLREQLGDVSEERLKWEVALRFYSGDRRAQALIERKLREFT
ncbi:MAG: hypothetical protein KDA93_12960 [Planctomycetaceae bacterium]|nr:hypothetical protein [Planctomycetaceae bacterium]